MEIMAQFTIFLTAMALCFVAILLIMEGFCAVVRQVNKKMEVSPRLMKWVETLDWLKEEDDE